MFRHQQISPWNILFRKKGKSMWMRKKCSREQNVRWFGFIQRNWVHEWCGIRRYVFEGPDSLIAMPFRKDLICSCCVTQFWFNVNWPLARSRICLPSQTNFCLAGCYRFVVHGLIGRTHIKRGVFESRPGPNLAACSEACVYLMARRA